MKLKKIGDFYEAYDDDARTLAKECRLTLTKRRDRPMAGFPYHMFSRIVEELKGKGIDVETE
jgi:DNA mismatch repair protein MutS